MTLPLSKTLDPADFALLPAELLIVDHHFTRAREQHPMRRWEYAMALRAENVWRATTGRDVYRGYDVGGAGSPFRHMGSVGLVVDPEEPSPDNYTLEQFCVAGTELASVVFCLSVLEHVEDLDQFLYHLNCLVAPGGLLFLTMDCCGCEQQGAWRLHHILPDDKDQHHFHWMRTRMFTRSSWEYLLLNLRPYGFELLGEHDWAYHGNHVFDYSFASLALVKRA